MVKEFYSIKFQKMMTVDEIRDIYYKMLARQPTGKQKKKELE